MLSILGRSMRNDSCKRSFTVVDLFINLNPITMKKILLISLLLSGITCFGQVATTVLELTDANVWLNSNGMFFNNYAEGVGGYEVPANSENSAIFSSGLWIGGVDSLENLYASAITYCQDNQNGFCEYYPGPLTTDGTASSTTESLLEYNRFWFISRDQVEAHALYADCVNDPDCDTAIEFPGYVIPQEIIEWPAHGDIANGFAYHLAPFIDVDGDGAYYPENGDYPSFTGDKAVYLIMNDKGGPHIDSGGEPFGVEVHTMFYYFLDANPALSRTIYVHQDIINRSETDYQNVYMGIWNDFDLGNPFNDMVGTNVENTFVFAKNGSIDNPSSQGPGYGAVPVRIACKILAGPYLDANGVDDANPFNSNLEYGDYTKGWADGIIDNERMGLSSSTYTYSMTGSTAPPQSTLQYYGMLRSIWGNGTPFTFGGTGYNPTDVDALPAKYVYPGESDPYFMSTDGVDPNYPLPGGWTEESAGNDEGDRRMNANCGPFSLKAGQKQSMDYAFVFAIQTDDPEADMDDMITDYVITAAEQVDVLPAGVLTSVKRVDNKEIGFELYPNPASGEVTLSIAENVPAKYRIFNVLGAEVSSGNLQSGQATIDISTLRSGIYLVNVQVGGVSGTRKLVVE